MRLKNSKSIIFFGRFPAGRAVTGFAIASVLRYSPHWLTPPSTSLTRFAIRTIWQQILFGEIAYSVIVV